MISIITNKNETRQHAANYQLKNSEETLDSDYFLLTMMTAGNISDSCSMVLNSIRCSDLNYSCQETPYSIYVTIRKSWSRQGQALHQVPVKHVQQIQVDEDRNVAKINSLNQELIDVKVDLETSIKLMMNLK